MITVASEEVAGSTGDSIALSVEVGENVLAAVGPNELIFVRIDARTQAYPLNALAGGLVVFRFSSRESARVSYQLKRDVGATIPDGVFRIHQVTSSRLVRRLFRPFVNGASTFASNSPLACVINAASQEVCGNNVTVSPFFAPPSPNIGGTFSSLGGSGPSVKITISLSVGVDSVRTAIYDPSFAGNMMVVYDSTGAQIGSVSFSFSGMGGINHPDTETVVAHGIRRIDLIPADTDYVAYDVSFSQTLPVCPHDGDPLMDSTIVRQQMAQLYSQTGAGGALPDTAFREAMLAVYQNADGSLNVIQPPQQATACTVTFQLPAPGILDPTLLGLIHVHNEGAGHPSFCPGAGNPDSRFLSDGLSIDDLLHDLSQHTARQNAGLPDISDDVIDIDKIWRNNPSAPASQRNTHVDRVPATCKWF